MIHDIILRHNQNCKIYTNSRNFKQHGEISSTEEQKENGELISRDSEYRFQELLAMAPLHDPIFQRDIRTIP